MLATRLAFTLLTILPLRGPERVDRRLAGRAMVLAPVAGFVLGSLAAVVVVTLRVLIKVPATNVVPAVAGIATLAWLTRGLHLDGLADVADGLGAGRERGRSLEVMRGSEIGAFGAATMLFVVLGQVTALAVCIPQHHGTVSLVVAAVSGRLAVTLACRVGVPSARPDGLGALVAGTVRPVLAAVAVVLVLCFAAVAGLLDVDGGHPGEALHAVMAVVASLVVTTLVRRRLVVRLGGITGDVLGSLVEIGTLVTLLVMTMQIPYGIRHHLGLV